MALLNTGAHITFISHHAEGEDTCFQLPMFGWDTQQGKSNSYFQLVSLDQFNVLLL